MILTVAGQSQQLSHICTRKFSGVFNGIRADNLCDASAVLLPSMKPLRCKLVNLLGSYVPVKAMMSERNISFKMHLFALKSHFAQTVQSISQSVFICTLLIFYNNYRFKKMLHTFREKKRSKGSRGF